MGKGEGKGAHSTSQDQGNSLADKSSSSLATSSDLPAILAEPRLAPFTSNNFDVATFVSRVLAGSHTTAQAQSEALKDGVRELDAALATEVLARNKELLTMVSFGVFVLVCLWCFVQNTRVDS